MRILIIIPTYNERENIEKLLTKLLKHDAKPDILVIDDNSPDSTHKIVKRMINETNQDRLFLIKRKSKLGLGSAYKLGFKYALENLYDLIFEMDADFSHSPEYINNFLEKIKSFDCVVGSRYIPGGKIIGWNFLRYFISFGGNLLSRFLLRSKIKDMTSGFRCYKREVLELIDYNMIISEGYFFQVEILYRIMLQGFKIIEIPITFVDREKGKSKMSGVIFWEALRNLLRIKQLKSLNKK